MKNLLKKTIKTFPSIIIILAVFFISFIFVNNKMNSNFETLNIDLSGNQNLVANIIPKDNKNNKDETVINPYYYGVGIKGLTPLQVSLLTKDFKKSTASFMTAVSPVDQVWYFAYPESYPALKSIKDQNGFELISDFTVTTGNSIINSKGNKVPYRIYEYNNVTTLSSYKVTYIQS